MDVTRQKALLESCLTPTRERRPPLDGEETQVPVSLYLDPDRFEAERALHRQGLSLVAHSSEVREPGDFLTLTVGDSPVIVVRGDDGVVRAFLNVCRHRGSRVERRDRGHCKRFVCPYHAWSYEAGWLARQGPPQSGVSLLGEPIDLPDRTGL